MAATAPDSTQGIERHHIIPKALGGGNEKNNIAILTPRAHYIAHLLLLKMCKNPEHLRSMSFAFFRMRASNGKNKRIVKNSRVFELARKVAIEHVSGNKNPFYGKGRFGKDNHFFGKKHTKISIEKMKMAQEGKNIGKDNPFFGKKHTTKTKNVLRKNKSIAITVVFHSNKRIHLDSGSKLGEYLGKSCELGRKLVNPKFAHLLQKYNISHIERHLS